MTLHTKPSLAFMRATLRVGLGMRLIFGTVSKVLTVLKPSTDIMIEFYAAADPRLCRGIG